jgi:uncharacterized protein YfbU (UPF0304 family)
MDSQITTLSPIERKQLSNQFLILEKLDSEKAEYYAAQREIVERGYTIKYEEVFRDIYDEMPIDECRYVYDVLEMYRILIRSFDGLKDKQGLTPDDVRFQGFDGNNETKCWAFAEYLQEKGMWKETLTGGVNSHSMMTMSLYPRMLSKYEPMKKELSKSARWILTADQIREVIS